MEVEGCWFESLAPPAACWSVLVQYAVPLFADEQLAPYLCWGGADKVEKIKYNSYSIMEICFYRLVCSYYGLISCVWNAVQS